MVSARGLKVVISPLLFVALSTTSYSQAVPKFMGRKVTVIDPGTDASGFEPKGPASICIEGPPVRQCYTAPKGFGREPKLTVVRVEKDMQALLFSAGSHGVSGWSVHLALLQPGKGANLENLFAWDDISVSNQNQHTLWDVPAIASSAIFVTAVLIWGPDEAHYGEHRYIISSYVRRPTLESDASYYYLDDQYMTARKYNLDANADILGTEKPAILARLQRAKAARLQQDRR